MGSRFSLLWVLPLRVHLGMNNCIVTPPEGSLGEEWVPLSGVGASYQSLGFCLEARSSCIQQLWIQKLTERPTPERSGAMAAKRGLHWKPPSHPPSTEMSTERPLCSPRKHQSKNWSSRSCEAQRRQKGALTRAFGGSGWTQPFLWELRPLWGIQKVP